MKTFYEPSREPDMTVAVDVDVSPYDQDLWFPEMVLVENNSAYRLEFYEGKLYYNDGYDCIVLLADCAQREYELWLARQITSE